MKQLLLLAAALFAGNAGAMTYVEINDAGHVVTSDSLVSHTSILIDDMYGGIERVSSAATASAAYGKNGAGVNAFLYSTSSAYATSIWSDRFSIPAGGTISIASLLSANTWMGGEGRVMFDLIMYTSEMSASEILDAVDQRSESVSFLMTMNVAPSSYVSRTFTAVVDESEFYLASILRSSTSGYGLAGSGTSFAIISGNYISSSGTIYLTTPVPEPEQYAMFIAGLAILGFKRRSSRRLLAHQSSDLRPLSSSD